MLPEALWLSLSFISSFAQTSQTLSLNSLSSFTPQNIPNPPTFSLPKSNNLTITVALCSLDNSQPRFLVTNGSTTQGPNSNRNKDVFEIFMNQGHGSWNGILPNESVLAVEGSGQASFELGVSDQGPLHESTSALPLLGDSTSNQVLLFSPPFSPPDYTRPTYPQYIFPPANLSLPSPPNPTPNFTLRIFPTANVTLSTIPQTGCSLASQDSVGVIAREDLWFRDQRGWRRQWLIEGLAPSTNYTVYVVQDSTKVSGPIYFATKSAAFSCPLVFNLPYCPNIAYTVPLPPPATDDTTAYTSENLPEQISSTLLSYMTNFTVTLSTFACGRDKYSPVVNCDDCEREYRKWLCAITFTRCGEPSPANSDAFTRTVAQPTATGLSAKSTNQQPVYSALVPQSTDTNARSPTLPAMGSSYSMLLPCLEMCTAVDRACPNLIGFRCPRVQFNAAASYGVGYIDSADGLEGQGATGRAQDRWGNIWCNGD